MTNAAPPKSWTYNNVKDSQTGVPDADTDPIWTILDIVSRACEGLNLAAAPGGNFSPIIGAIWGQFINNPGGAQNLTNGVTAHGAGGKPGPNMHYWQNPKLMNGYRNSGLDTSLIANLDGPCAGWASLLVDCLPVEGINAYVYAIQPIASFYTAPNQGDVFAGFRVSSTLGQGNKSAQTDFTDHAVVELTNNDTGPVYDPSYGMPYASEQAWMDGAEGSFLWTNGDEVQHGAGNPDSKFSLLPV